MAIRFRRPEGELAIVLHTHMPYVEGGAEWPSSPEPEWEGFGTWPFGEEWLWEAIASSYLPLLDVLGRAPITLSLTPVLCDQLEAPGAMDRCLAFLREVRPASHGLDIEEYRGRGETELLPELERSAAEYAEAVERLERLPDGLLGALGRHASWTSAATHPVLPLLATDAGAEIQVRTGIASHRRRFGSWNGGFWLPECAHASWLDALLEEAGVRATCIEMTSLLGLGSERHMRPLATDEGPVLWPIDRQTIALVWGRDGYPSHPAYRDYHHLTKRDHRLWANSGGPYDHRAARQAAKQDAGDFVARVKQRVKTGGVCVCAVDTELLGHWWYEGIAWLTEVLEEANRQRLPLTTLDDALTRHDPEPAPPSLPVSSWGEGGDLRTWSGPAVADLAWQARTAEMKLLARGPVRARERALRELLALQSSDWSFLVTRGSAGDYPLQRASGHAAALQAALAGQELPPRLRNLAPDLVAPLGR
jgi:1,4-alpha-glucan branching enzyme